MIVVSFFAFDVHQISNDNVLNLFLNETFVNLFFFFFTEKIKRVAKTVLIREKKKDKSEKTSGYSRVSKQFVSFRWINIFLLWNRYI